MKVRVTVVLEKEATTLAQALEQIGSIKAAVESVGTVKKWKETVVGK